MKILHTYCLNYNLGDYALGIGVKNLLRHHFEVDLIGDTNIQGREFTQYYISEVVNKKYDLLIVGGGGIIHGAHWPNGWFWLIDLELIKEIKIPFIVYGVGYNYWENEEKIPQHAIEHLKETQKRALYFSVRNDGSAERLKRDTGIKSSVLPDPGFHINLNTDYPPVEKEKYVIIQLANDKPEYRFGSKEKREAFISQMREITLELSKSYKVIFAPHVQDDIELSSKISKGIKNSRIWDFGYYAFDHTHDAIGFYKYASFVIAMRGHGQIIPIAFNTPVISLENHPKHRGLMAELGLLDYNIQIGQENFVNTVFQKIQLISEDSISSKLQIINNRLIQNTHTEFSTIKEKLKHGK